MARIAASAAGMVVMQGTPCETAAARMRETLIESVGSLQGSYAAPAAV